MYPISASLQRKIVTLLEQGTSVLGLKLCFRDRTKRAGLPGEWWLHVVPACLEHKNDTPRICTDFAEGETNRAMAGAAEGMIRGCPFGFTEIVVPVMVEGYYVGPLFAGPCWLNESPPPHPSLVVPPSRAWLEERLTLVRAIAAQIGRLMTGEPTHRPQKRRAVIMEYLQERLDGEVSIHELASRLNLSASRTTHLMRELFSTSLPLLARHVRLQEAARELVSTDLLIGEISRRHGFSDQNYFSRIFSQSFGMSPRQYRKTYPAEA